MAVNVYIPQLNGFIPASPSEIGDTVFSGGSEGAIPPPPVTSTSNLSGLVFVLLFPWIHADKSCDGIFPFTLKVPSLNLCFPEGLSHCEDATATTHVSFLPPCCFLASQRDFARIHSSLMTCASVWSSPISPAHAGDSRSIKGRMVWRRSCSVVVTLPNKCQCSLWWMKRNQNTHEKRR